MFLLLLRLVRNRHDRRKKKTVWNRCIVAKWNFLDEIELRTYTNWYFETGPLCRLYVITNTVNKWMNELTVVACLLFILSSSFCCRILKMSLFIFGIWHTLTIVHVLHRYFVCLYDGEPCRVSQNKNQKKKIYIQRCDEPICTSARWSILNRVNNINVFDDVKRLLFSMVKFYEQNKTKFKPKYLVYFWNISENGRFGLFDEEKNDCISLASETSRMDLKCLINSRAMQSFVEYKCPRMNSKNYKFIE